MLRKFEKRSSLSHGEEPTNCALAHCLCKNDAESFDRHLTQTCQNYSRQDLYQYFRALKALTFRAVCVEYPSSMLARFRVRERNYLSVRFVFRVSEVRGLPDGFSWLLKNRLTSVQLKTLNSLMCFSLVQNCWRWLSLILSSSSAKKETQTKIGLSSVTVRDLFCSRPIGACLSRTFSSLLIGTLFHMDYSGYDVCFPEAFYKCSNNLFAWSEILENGLLCGGVRRK